jgi:cysteine desulfurase
MSNFDRDVSHMTRLRDRIIDSVLEIEGSALNGPRHDRLCNNTHFRFEGVKGTELVIKLSGKGIAASTASACSASDNEPSHVLSAIGLNAEQALSSLRLTLSGLNTDEDVDRLLSVLPETIRECRSK